MISILFSDFDCALRGEPNNCSIQIASRNLPPDQPKRPIKNLNYSFFTKWSNKQQTVAALVVLVMGYVLHCNRWMQELY